MTLRLIPDDEDDRMSANPEEPRGDLGYADTTAPRLRARPTGRPTHWAFVEREGAARDAGEVGAPAKHCARCGEPAPVLHAAPGSIVRSICGKCEGAANRDRIGWGSGGAA